MHDERISEVVGSGRLGDGSTMGTTMGTTSAGLSQIRQQLNMLEAAVLELWRTALSECDEARIGQLVSFRHALRVAGHVLQLEPIGSTVSPRPLVPHVTDVNEQPS